MTDNNSDKNYRKTTLSKGDLIEDIDSRLNNQGQDDSNNQVSPDNNDLEKLISNIDSDIEKNYGQVITPDYGELETEKETDEEKYIVFTLLNKKYGVPILNVLEIGDLTNTTPVPNLPNWIRGVTNIRGEIVSIIDLGTYLGIPKMERLDSEKMLVIRSLDDEINAAIIVDQINQMYTVSSQNIMKPESPVDNKIAPFLHGVCEFNEELLLLLDLEKFFDNPEIKQFQ